MPPTTAYRFGDLVLVPFPFTNQSGVKKRPAVVVSSQRYHSRRRDVIIMPVTSRLKATLGFGEIVLREWKKAGLLVPSAVKPVLATIEKVLIIRRLGQLQESDRESVRGALGLVLG